MAFQKVKKTPQFADLVGILAQSRGVDEALYQTVQEIINRLDQFAADIVGGTTGERGATGPPGPTPTLDQTFITVNPEATLPNERALVAGVNVTLDLSTPGQIAINSTGGSGGGPHAPTHQPGGSDPMQVDAAPTVGSLRTLGSGPNQAAPGNDIRFTVAPLHAPTHSQGGSDPVDVRNLVGYPGGTTSFLRADRTFAIPPTGSGGGGGMEYLGDYVTPHTYNDGDIVIAADGIAYVCTVNGTTTPPEPWPGGGMAVNVSLDATYWTATPHSALINEYALGLLANGYVKSTAGVPSTVAAIPPGDLPPFIAYTNIANSWSVGQTFPLASVVGDYSTLYLKDVNAPVDQKVWRFVNYHDGRLFIESMNDAQTVVGAQYFFRRDGYLQSLAFAGDGQYITGLNAANIAYNLVPTARLGNGTANSGTFLRGDSTWQTIGGVPSGAVILFNAAACPPGYTRIAAWDGYYVRMGPVIAAGGSNTHSHTAGTFAAPAHTHSGTSLSVDSHNHGNVTVGFGITISGTTGGGGSHDHSFSGTTGGESSGVLSVDGGASGNCTRGTHTHGFSGTTANEANHTHSFSGSGSGSGSGATGNATPGINGNTGSGGGGTITGSSQIANNMPLYVDMLACQKD
jgi:hypothetical protein